MSCPVRNFCNIRLRNTIRIYRVIREIGTDNVFVTKYLKKKKKNEIERIEFRPMYQTNIIRH